MLFESDEPKPGTGGKVTLWVNDKQIGEGRMPQDGARSPFTCYAGMDIGRDNGGVVDLDYEDKAPYAFTGTVKKVVFDLAPHAHGDEMLAAPPAARRRRPVARTAPPAHLQDPATCRRARSR